VPSLKGVAIRAAPDAVDQVHTLLSDWRAQDAPLMHELPREQGDPQAPQLAGSLAMSEHPPSQSNAGGTQVRASVVVPGSDTAQPTTTGTMTAADARSDASQRLIGASSQ
jgi:hypothetical protein